MRHGTKPRNPKAVLACIEAILRVCKGMVAFSLFPGDTVVLISLLGIMVAALAGKIAGGVRSGMFLGSTIVSLIASTFLADSAAFSNLAVSIGFEYPLWKLLVPRVLAFFAILLILTAILEGVHKKVYIHYKYKHHDTPSHFNTWEYLNAIWGLALGVVIGGIYLIGFFALVHVPGYMLIQLQTSAVTADLDSFGHKAVRRVFRDMHTLGLDNTTAWFAPAGSKYYQAADTIGFIYHNHALTNNFEFNRFHRRVINYPGLSEALNYEPFRNLLFPTNKSKILQKLQHHTNFMAIAQEKDVRLVVTAACSPKDEKTRQFVDALSKIDLKDYREFMKTGRSRVYEDGTANKPILVGMWQIDIAATVNEFIKHPQYSFGAHNFHLDLMDFMKKGALWIDRIGGVEVDRRHDFTLNFSVGNDGKNRVHAYGRFFPSQRLVTRQSTPGSPSDILKFSRIPIESQVRLMAAGFWQQDGSPEKFRIEFARAPMLMEVTHLEKRLYIKIPGLNNETYVFSRYEY